MLIIIVIGSVQIVFQKGYNTACPTALGKNTVWWRSPPVMNVIALFDIAVASLMDIKQYLSIILIRISPTTSEEQHLILSIGSVLKSYD